MSGSRSVPPCARSWSTRPSLTWHRVPCRTGSPASGPTPIRGSRWVGHIPIRSMPRWSGLAEDARPTRPDVHDLALLQLVLGGLLPRHLGPDVAAVPAHQLDPDLEAQVDHAFDHGFDCTLVRLGEDVQV